MINRKRKASRGTQIVHLAGLIFISLMISALGVDFSYYYAAQNKLQTAADAAALAGTLQLYRSESSVPNQKLIEAKDAAVDFVVHNEPELKLADGDVAFGYVNPVSKLYNPTTFGAPSSNPSYTSTNGYNAVRVKVLQAQGSANAPLHSILANLFGVSSMDTGAYAVAFIDKNITSIGNGGLRPIYACDAQVQKAIEDGVLENNTIRVYGDHLEVDGVGNIANCPLPGSGNWGFSDFTNCGPGTIGSSTIGDWFMTGYPGSVDIGKCYSTKPGNFISSISPKLDTLINDEVIFPIPLYDTWGGGGSNTFVNITGFVGFQLTSYKGNGPEASRYMEGHFRRYVCNKGCASNGTGTASTGSTVVKIRLAAQS